MKSKNDVKKKTVLYAGKIEVSWVKRSAATQKSYQSLTCFIFGELCTVKCKRRQEDKNMLVDYRKVLIYRGVTSTNVYWKIKYNSCSSEIFFHCAVAIHFVNYNHSWLFFFSHDLCKKNTRYKNIVESSCKTVENCHYY